jgi:signal transduction histidine kinase
MVVHRPIELATLIRECGKLVEAHEEERTWIARELHDDISQQVALLANNLALLEQELPDLIAEIRNRVSE